MNYRIYGDPTKGVAAQAATFSVNPHNFPITFLYTVPAKYLGISGECKMAENDKIPQVQDDENELEQKGKDGDLNNEIESETVLSDFLHAMGFKNTKKEKKTKDKQEEVPRDGEMTESVEEEESEHEVMVAPERRIRRRWPLGVFGAMALGGAALGIYHSLPMLQEPKPPAPNVVATYNEQKITIEELKNFIAVEGAKEREHMLCPTHGYDHSKCDATEECEIHPVDSLEGYQEMVSKMASEQMILNWAKEKGITGREEVQHNMEDLLNDATVEQYMSQLHEENVSPESISKTEVQQYYSENQDKFKGKSLDESEEEIRKTLASEKDGSFFETYFEELKKTSGLQVNYDVLEVNTPTKEEISDYYEQNKEKYQTSASADYSEIKIADGKMDTATEAVRKIRSGESLENIAGSFGKDKKVFKNSIDLSSDTELGKTIATMKEGEISEPIENEDGSISIIKVNQKKEGGVKKLSEVTKEIENILLQENIDKEYTTRKNDTLFVVHSRRYTLGDFYKEFQELSEEYRSKFSTFEKKKKLVEQMIAKELLLEKSTDGADDGENSHSFEELQVQYLYQVMHQETVDTNLDEPTEEEIKQYYEENKESLVTPASVELSLIWISQGENGEKKEQAKTSAEEAYGLLKEGKDFAEVAKQYSEDTSAENGGQITGQIYKNHLAEPLAEAAFSLNENEFSNVIEYQNAFYILLVRSKSAEELKPLEELSDAIKSHLNEQAHDKLSEELSQQILNDADLKIYDRTLKKMLTET